MAESMGQNSFRLEEKLDQENGQQVGGGAAPPSGSNKKGKGNPSNPSKSGILWKNAVPMWSITIEMMAISLMKLVSRLVWSLGVFAVSAADTFFLFGIGLRVPKRPPGVPIPKNSGFWIKEVESPGKVSYNR